MFYGLLLEDAAFSSTSLAEEVRCPAQETDLSWYLGLEAWVQLSVGSLAPATASPPLPPRHRP